MKRCPSCGELIGESVDVCFNCRYNFKTGVTMGGGQEEEVYVPISENEKRSQIGKNARYEYRVIEINDDYTGDSEGRINVFKLQNIIDEYATAGWRIKTTFTNEIGRNAQSVTFGSYTTGTNATIDQIVIIFERCIKAAEE